MAYHCTLCKTLFCKSELKTSRFIEYHIKEHFGQFCDIFLSLLYIRFLVQIFFNVIFSFRFEKVSFLWTVHQIDELHSEKEEIKRNQELNETLIFQVSKKQAFKW
jgi:hypothetical protein